jgi:hypothetical protein
MAASTMANDAPSAGIYNLADNINITGGQAAQGFSSPGIDFGAGLIQNPNYTNSYHYLSAVKLDGSTTGITTLDRGTFAHTVWNPNVSIFDSSQNPIPRPHRMDSFILLSAGPDAIFGTGDDIANFDIFQGKE